MLVFPKASMLVLPKASMLVLPKASMLVLPKGLLRFASLRLAHLANVNGHLEVAKALKIGLVGNRQPGPEQNGGAVGLCEVLV